MRVELTRGGDLILPAEVAEACFPEAASVLIALRGEELWAMRMGGRAVGGFILKQRNLRGDRSVLVIEPLFEVEWSPGEREGVWDEEERALRVPLLVAAPEAVG